MVDKCKHCGSKELYLEPRVKGQDILMADMVALKCKSCGKWLKWCPKNERVNYLKIKEEKPDKWQKLKEFISNRSACAGYVVQVRLIWDILEKMQELEGEDDK